jgi:hypothetical protein
MDGLVWFAVAVAVGKNPHSVASVVGIDGTSRNNKRLDGVSERLKRVQDFPVEEVSSASICHVSDASDSTTACVHVKFTVPLDH